MEPAAPFRPTPHDPLAYVPAEASWAVDEFVRMPPSVAARLFPCFFLLLAALGAAYAYWVEVPVTVHGHGQVVRAETVDGTVVVTVALMDRAGAPAAGMAVLLHRAGASGSDHGTVIALSPGDGPAAKPTLAARLTTGVGAAAFAERPAVEVSLVTGHARLLSLFTAKLRGHLVGAAAGE